MQTFQEFCKGKAIAKRNFMTKDVKDRFNAIVKEVRRVENECQAEI